MLRKGRLLFYFMCGLISFTCKQLTQYYPTNLEGCHWKTLSLFLEIEVLYPVPLSFRNEGEGEWEKHEMWEFDWAVYAMGREGCAKFK